MKRQRLLLNHNPETAPIIAKIVEADGKKQVVLQPPFDKNPVYIDGAQLIQSFLDR